MAFPRSLNQCVLPKQQTNSVWWSVCGAVRFIDIDFSMLESRDLDLILPGLSVAEQCLSHEASLRPIFVSGYLITQWTLRLYYFLKKKNCILLCGSTIAHTSNSNLSAWTLKTRLNKVNHMSRGRVSNQLTGIKFRIIKEKLHWEQGELGGWIEEVERKDIWVWGGLFEMT